MKRTLLTAILVLLSIIYLISCSKEYSIETGKQISPASGSLKDTFGNCLPSSVHGSFYAGIVPGADTAYLEVVVNVTNPGTYTITTDTANGFWFADSNYFDHTGLDTVLLKPVGTPILPKQTDFVIYFDTSICPITVDVASQGAWEFTSDDAGYLHGTIDTSYTFDTLGYHYLIMAGFTQNTDSVFYLAVSFPGTSIATGTYAIQSGYPSFNGFELDDPMTDPIYLNFTDPTGKNDGSITVDYYDNMKQQISGTFNGLANNAAGDAVVNISNGRFSTMLMK